MYDTWLDLAPEPWKNGGGVTRTLAVDADMPPGAPPRWRVSIADIERHGAYSRFAGYDRVSVVLSGAGVALRADSDLGVDHGGGADVMLRPGVATAFSGDVAMQAQLLAGPVRVLNVFVLRDAAMAEVQTSATASVHAGALRLTAGPTSVRRIVVAGSHYQIDAACPGGAWADQGGVGPDPLPPGAVQIVVRVAAHSPR